MRMRGPVHRVEVCACDLAAVGCQVGTLRYRVAQAVRSLDRADTSQSRSVVRHPKQGGLWRLPREPLRLIRRARCPWLAVRAVVCPAVVCRCAPAAALG